MRLVLDRRDMTPETPCEREGCFRTVPKPPTSHKGKLPRFCSVSCRDKARNARLGGTHQPSPTAMMAHLAAKRCTVLPFPLGWKVFEGNTLAGEGETLEAAVRAAMGHHATPEAA